MSLGALVLRKKEVSVILSPLKWGLFRVFHFSAEATEEHRDFVFRIQFSKRPVNSRFYRSPHKLLLEGTTRRNWRRGKLPLRTTRKPALFGRNGEMARGV